VMLHSVEIARAAESIFGVRYSARRIQRSFASASVLVNMRPFGFYSMPDIEARVEFR